VKGRAQCPCKIEGQDVGWGVKESSLEEIFLEFKG
jgi:hypothetical protein